MQIGTAKSAREAKTEDKRQSKRQSKTADETETKKNVVIKIFMGGTFYQGGNLKDRINLHYNSRKKIEQAFEAEAKNGKTRLTSKDLTLWMQKKYLINYINYNLKFKLLGAYTL